MNVLENYYKKIIRYDLINKFFYRNLNDIPELKKIILNFSTQNIAASFLILELITGKQGTITKSKRTNILLKIRKGNPIGCIIILKKTSMYCFFWKLLTEVFPNSKDFKKINVSRKLSGKNLSLILADLIYFKELEKQFYLFKDLPPLNITFVINSKIPKEIVFLLHSFKIPLF